MVAPATNGAGLFPEWITTDVVWRRAPLPCADDAGLNEDEGRERQ